MSNSKVSTRQRSARRDAMKQAAAAYRNLTAERERQDQARVAAAADWYVLIDHQQALEQQLDKVRDEQAVIVRALCDDYGLTQSEVGTLLGSDARVVAELKRRDLPTDRSSTDSVEPAAEATSDEAGAA